MTGMACTRRLCCRRSSLWALYMFSRPFGYLSRSIVRQVHPLAGCRSLSCTSSLARKMTKHQPFKEVEGSRPDFPEMEATYSKTPDPGWKPGQGLNQMSATKDFDPTAAQWRTIKPEDYADSKGQLYKLMISGITPRPIAFMSTEGPNGEYNLAPFSYFNVVSHDPPTIIVSIQSDPSKDGGLKDTAANVMRTKQFCCSIISEPFLEAANYTSIDAPYGTDEWALAGLTKRKSEVVKPPHVAESAFSMECELSHHHELINDDGKKTNTVVFGRVKRFHVKESVFDKDDDMKVLVERLKPVSRLGGITYGRTTHVLELPRPKWDEVKDTSDVQEALKKGAADK